MPRNKSLVKVHSLRASIGFVKAYGVKNHANTELHLPVCEV